MTTLKELEKDKPKEKGLKHPKDGFKAKKPKTKKTKGA